MDVEVAEESAAGPKEAVEAVDLEEDFGLVAFLAFGEGRVQARRSAVTHTKYYEVKAMVNGGNPAPAIWDTLPILLGRPGHPDLQGSPCGQLYLSIRIRAIGSKGPRPWKEAVTLRVN